MNEYKHLLDCIETYKNMPLGEKKRMRWFFIYDRVKNAHTIGEIDAAQCLYLQGVLESIKCLQIQESTNI